MADNLVSQPPLTIPITDGNGILSKAWAIWFRDLYRRTGYKGGNAIDDLAAEISKIKSSIPIDMNSQVEFLQRQINGLPEFTIDTSGFTVDSTFITTDKVLA